MSRSPAVVFLYTTVQLKMIQVTKYESLESKTLIIWDIMMAEPQLGPTKKEVINIRDRCWQRLLTSKYGVSVGNTYICVICTGWLCCGYFVIHILGILKKSFTAGKIAFVLNWAVCGVEYTWNWGFMKTERTDWWFQQFSDHQSWCFFVSSCFFSSNWVLLLFSVHITQHDAYRLSTQKEAEMNLVASVSFFSFLS